MIIEIFFPILSNTMNKALMRNFLKTISAIAICIGFMLQPALAQYSTVDSLDKKLLNWQNFDYKADKIPGISLEKAYRDFLKGREPKKQVVVAVIDSGVDTEHEDLKGKIWVNEREIPGNGIDDDGNGYIDDIHGWNFLGNAKGENVNDGNLEQTRIVRAYGQKFNNVDNPSTLSEEDRGKYLLFLDAKKTLEKELKEKMSFQKNLEAFEKSFKLAEEVIANELNNPDFKPEDLKKINSKDDNVVRAKKFLADRYKDGLNRKLLAEIMEQNREHIEKYLNLNFNPRAIIGDNEESIEDRYYGNNQVKGERADHGTLVAGLIAANRNNGVGINGISENARIMALRAVPHGDEHDKDVALSIIYAVENGANIINLSFGKDFSPYKPMVDQAIRLAEERNVLIIHAAGNNALNIDEVERYPSKRLDDNTVARAWINVGASSKSRKKDFAAPFTNYGQKNVDLFAPGVDVISLYPDSRYDRTDGTSFSSPVVAGVAALVWSHFPELTALELKEVLLESAQPFKSNTVYLPNTSSPEKKKVKFGTLSQTGGVVNAYQALILAEKKVKR
jgi:subtilisin family serine protease